MLQFLCFFFENNPFKAGASKGLQGLLFVNLLVICTINKWGLSHSLELLKFIWLDYSRPPVLYLKIKGSYLT